MSRAGQPALPPPDVHGTAPVRRAPDTRPALALERALVLAAAGALQATPALATATASTSTSTSTTATADATSTASQATHRPADHAAAIQRGAALAASRSQGLCVLCHALPGQPSAQQGTVGPPLHGVGARFSPAQLRARLLAPEQFNADSLMPGYGPRSGLQRVPAALQGQPLLQPAQIDDLVAWLASLR